MSAFLYRVDRLKHLRNVQDKFFRARFWPNGNDYPHKALHTAQQSIPAGLRIFRICFWSSFDRAEKSLQIDYRHWSDGVITRVPLEDVRNLGFTETWDDGFNEGEAYLFWQYGASLFKDTTLSTSGISTECIQAYKDGAWTSFEAVVFPDREEASLSEGAENKVMQQATKRRSSNPTHKSLWQRLKRVLFANG